MSILISEENVKETMSDVMLATMLSEAMRDSLKKKLENSWGRKAIFEALFK